jgi:hypothetical protein
MDCITCHHEIILDTEHYDTPRWAHARIVDVALCTAHRDGSECRWEPWNTPEVLAGKLTGDE